MEKLLGNLSGFLETATGQETGNIDVILTEIETDVLTTKIFLPKETIASLQELALALTIRRGLRTFLVEDITAAKQDAFVVGQIALLNRMINMAKPIK